MKRIDIQRCTKQRQQIKADVEETITAANDLDRGILKQFLEKRMVDSKNVREEIERCSQQHSLNSKEQCKVIGMDFENQFRNVKLETEHPIFVFFYDTPYCSAFCIMRDEDDKPVILYKDPRGVPIKKKFERHIVKNFPGVKIIVHKEAEIKGDDAKVYSQIFTLRNFKVMVYLYKKEPREFIASFTKIKFSNFINVFRPTIEDAVKLAQDVVKNIEFKTAFKDFFDKLPLDLGSDLLNFQKYLKFELQKDRAKIDLKRIKKKRETFLNKKSLDKLKDYFKVHLKENQTDAMEYELDIEKKFPAEIQNLKYIFTVLNDFKVDRGLLRLGEILSEIFEINPKKLTLFYKFSVKKIRGDEGELTPDSIDKVIKELSPIKHRPTRNPPIEELLTQVAFGTEFLVPPPEDIEALKKQFSLVKSEYDKIQKFNLKNIREWAVSKKGKLRNIDEDICTALAVMDRAFVLLNRGYHLRDTQILAVIIFFYNGKNKGRICQVNSREGKTIIVSLLAVIKALQGFTVDVILDTENLATIGVIETKTFYSVFGLTVSTNNIDKNKRNSYASDVLYGTLLNFQIDYLQDSIRELNVCRVRKFGHVIVDEIDCMLVKDERNIATVKSTFCGMDYLKYVFIYMWQEVTKHEIELFQQGYYSKIIQHILTNEEMSDDHAESLYNNIITEVRKQIYIKMTDCDPSAHLAHYSTPHLKKYIVNKLDQWITSAIKAKQYEEDVDYHIKTCKDGEKIVVPIGHQLLSNGLKQFIELKHNLNLTLEPLTIVCISNITFFGFYKNIFGITGPSGSKAERTFLSYVYNVTYAKTPTNHSEKVNDIALLVFTKKEWPTEITIQIMEKISTGNSVIVFLKSRSDFHEIKGNLEALQDNFTVHTDEDVETEVYTLLAKNKRGKGWHVCVGFFPETPRTEYEIFAKSYRYCQNASCQFVARCNERGVTNDVYSTKKKKEKMENKKLNILKDGYIKELTEKDKWSQKFASFFVKDLHSNVYKAVEKRPSIFCEEPSVPPKFNFQYKASILEYIKEMWAFHFDDINVLLGFERTEASFDKFKKLATELLNDKTYSDNKIENPYFFASSADCFIEQNKYDSAVKEINKLLSQKENNLVSVANFKRVEAELKVRGRQFLQILSEIIKRLFGGFVKNIDTKYKSEASTYLKFSIPYLTNECNFIKDNILPFASKKTQPVYVTEIFLPFKENILLKHLHSRLTCLELQIAQLQEMANQINDAIKKNNEIDIQSSMPANLSHLKQVNGKLTLTQSELTDFYKNGFRSIYSLKPVENVSKAFYTEKLEQIELGLACFIAGVTFRPSFAIMSTIGQKLIAETIIDILLSIMTGQDDLSRKEYIEYKFTVYCKFSLSMDTDPVSQTIDLLHAAFDFCGKTMDCSAETKKAFEKVVEVVTPYVEISEKMLFKKMKRSEQLEQLLKLVKDKSKFEALGGAKKLEKLKKVSRYTKLIEDYVPRFLMWDFKSRNNHYFKQYRDKLIFNLTEDNLRETIKTQINVHRLEKKLSKVSLDSIMKTVHNFLDDNKVTKLIKELCNIHAKYIQDLEDIRINFRPKVLYRLQKEIRELLDIVSLLMSYLTKMESTPKGTNKIEDVIEKISDKVVPKIFDNIFFFVKEHMARKMDEDVKHCLNIKKSLYNVEYWKLVLRYHPSKRSYCPFAKEHFKKILYRKK